MDKPSDYIPTTSDLEAFRAQNSRRGHNAPQTRRKLLTGQLKYVYGHYMEIIAYDKPYNLLQSIKQKMIYNGYKKENLIITSRSGNAHSL